MRSCMPISSQHPATLPDQLAQTISSLVDQGLLKPGHRLPSIRAAAIEYGVAKNTVIEAYERLVALGYVRAQQGSGFFVSNVAPKSQDSRLPHIVQAVDMIWLLREQLEQQYAVRIGAGRPPQAWMEGSEQHPRNPRHRNRPLSPTRSYG